MNTGLDIIMLVLYNQRTVGLRFLASFPKMEMHAQQKLTSLLNIHTNLRPRPFDTRGRSNEF